MTYHFLGTLTGDGSTPSQVWKGKGRGNGTFVAFGTFDSGTLTLQMSLDDGVTCFPVTIGCGRACYSTPYKNKWWLRVPLQDKRLCT